MSKGIILFAENNERFNYVKMSYASGLMAKKNLNQGITLITNEEDIQGNEKYLEVFDKVITTKKSNKKYRTYKGTEKHSLSFYNSNRKKVFDLSPYDETIVIDADYLVMDKSLNKVWSYCEDFLINKNAKNILIEDIYPSDLRIADRSMPTRWATLIYFRKSKYSEKIFELVEHVSSAYDYFAEFYGFSSSVYRNDYVFSVACHMFNDFNDEGIGSFPINYVLTSTPDDFIEDISYNSITLKSRVHDGYKLYTIDNRNIHIMNKFELDKNLDRIIDLYAY